MKYYQYLLLDLDGTIIDPIEGITKSVAYALSHFGIEVTELAALRPFIGPPLKESFKEFYNFNDVQATEAVARYRERYTDIGIYENVLYEGIGDFLSAAVEQGRQLILATSKPTIFAERILEHFDLSRYFTFIGGSGFYSRQTKAEVIKHVLQSTHITDMSVCVMIGDRKYDILGAKEFGIDAIGVTYGHGSNEELSDAGATYIVNSVQALGQLLDIPF